MSACCDVGFLLIFLCVTFYWVGLGSVAWLWIVFAEAPRILIVHYVLFLFPAAWSIGCFLGFCGYFLFCRKLLLLHIGFLFSAIVIVLLSFAANTVFDPLQLMTRDYSQYTRDYVANRGISPDGTPRKPDHWDYYQQEYQCCGVGQANWEAASQIPYNRPPLENSRPEFGMSSIGCCSDLSWMEKMETLDDVYRLQQYIMVGEPVSPAYASVVPWIEGCYPQGGDPKRYPGTCTSSVEDFLARVEQQVYRPCLGLVGVGVGLMLLAVCFLPHLYRYSPPELANSHQNWRLRPYSDNPRFTNSQYSYIH